MIWTALKIAFGLAAAYAIWHSLPANADPYPGSHASKRFVAPVAKLQGPGPFLIINDNKVVVGVVQNGIAIAMEGVGSGTPAPAIGTVDNPNTTRIQIEKVWTNPHLEWDCPRGVSVLRYGKRGC